MSVVATSGLTKHFGDVVAVENLDLVIDRGEVVGYLGPNGAGKTTTIRLLLDFLRPTSGGATGLGGSGAAPEIRRRIGYLPGDFNVDRSYTAHQLFEFFGSLRGKLDRAWLGSLIERFSLDPTRPIGQLSTGNRRKVGLIQAFMSRPELFLLDEPTAGLDPLLQNEFNALVREVVADGATVLLSSHVLPEVEELAGRVAILRQGRLVAVVGVDELRKSARMTIEFSLGAEADASVVETRLRTVSGVLAVTSSATPPAVRVTVEGSVDAVLKAMSEYTVVRVVTQNADLEDIFLGYYTRGGS